MIIRPALDRAVVIEAGGRRMTLADGKAAELRATAQGVECRSGDAVLTTPLLRAQDREAGSAEFTLSVPGRISRLYRGILEIHVVDGELEPVVTMDLETAVASAVAAESPAGAPVAMLEAQAVVTRSYYVAGRRHRRFDFCDTTHCQFLREPPGAGSRASLAAFNTRGLVLIYQGDVIPALFSASCGGRTRSSSEIGLVSRGYPFYPVVCAYCAQYAPRWTKVLDRYDAGLSSPAGNEAARLLVDRRLGWSAIPGNNYALEDAGEFFILRGAGQGHGVGLCQAGASGLAADGRSFQEILNYFFPNTSLSDADATGHQPWNPQPE